MSDTPVPFLDLVTPHRELEDELVEAFRQSLRSAAFIGGAQVEGFEREFAEFCGSTHCVGVANGTDAVRFALMAAGVKPGDAVVTVAHTFIATCEAISQAGAATEFVDIDPRTYCMDPQALAAYLATCDKDPATGRPLGQRTKQPITAVVPVHLYGQVADMDAILAIAAKYDLLVVEDACQAHGAEYQCADGTWKRAGTFGKAGAFSFYPGKNLGALGEAGGTTTNDPELARKMATLRDHGQRTKYFHSMVGWNARMDGIQAAALSIKLRTLAQGNQARRQHARLYSELLHCTSGVATPQVATYGNPVFHLYVIRVADRDGLLKTLGERGVHCGIHYPRPVHLQEAYAFLGYQPGSLPVTERVAREILSLPMFPELTPEQITVVVRELKALLSTAAPVAA
jgi:dTDP-4-amino-4,6-dideoxygalactose transaminase